MSEEPDPRPDPSNARTSAAMLWVVIGVVAIVLTAIVVIALITPQT